MSYLNDAAQPVRALLAGSITMAADTEKLLQENAADQIGAGHALLTGHSWSQVKTHNKKIYMNGDVALKNVKYEHTNRPGFLLGLIGFFTAGLFFSFIFLVH